MHKIKYHLSRSLYSYLSTCGVFGRANGKIASFVTKVPILKIFLPTCDQFFAKFPKIRVRFAHAVPSTSLCNILH